MHSWRLGHRTGLDGLRGVAITLVVVSHLAPYGSRFHQLGGLGVVAFFTLSGFLITALLLEEAADRGRVDVPAFYLRRARRLGPALLACVAVLALATAVLPGLVSGRTTVAALTWSTNWLQVATDGHVVDALSHTWSLAVEEQFYLVWPWALLGLLRLPRHWQARVLAAAIAVAAVWPLTFDVDPIARVYAGTDTRAMPLLLGAWLAMRVHRHGAAARASGGLCAALVVVLASLAALPFGFQLLVAPQIVAGLTAAIIWIVASGPVRWLEAPALTWLGRRSYGLYLWHWPAIVISERLGFGTVPGVVAAFGLAVLSWRLVERPAMRWKPVTMTSHSPAR